MRITFIGATHEVTGSCFLLEACGRQIIIDCGLEQGKDIYENEEIPISPATIDAALVTHAHMDHSGKLPMLYAQGFRGGIHATKATTALCEIMLQDSAHIQQFEAEWKNRKRQRSGAEPFVPLYTMEDALATINCFVSHDYNKVYKLFEGIEVRFVDAGHLLGSSSIEIWITEEDVTKKIVFSGDIGNPNQPLIKDPQYVKEADYVVMESTYGDRSHGPKPDYVKELSQIIQTTFDRGGNVVIPSFAVGRTQSLLYFIRQIKEQNLVAGHGNFKVYIDSPLAIEATEIFNESILDYFDEEALEIYNKGINPITFPGLITAVSAEESKEINFVEEPKVIISASGMCEAGRIRHHLKHNLWRSECTVLFVGYQSVGSLGRIILEGAPEVKLFGEKIQVNAEILKLAGVSGHADREGLVKWIQAFEKKPDKVFVVHGDETAIEAFTERLNSQYGFDAFAPKNGAIYDLKANVLIDEGKLIEVQDHKEDNRKVSTVFERLLNAGKRLMAVIQHNEGGTNKDLAKFADQINSLCDKWDR